MQNVVTLSLIVKSEKNYLDNTMRKLKRIKHLCQCGCGQTVKRARDGTWNKYILGHNIKNRKSSHSAKTDHLFKQGISGNPKGRRAGSRNKVTVAAENLFTEESEAIARKAIKMALDGNAAMVKLILERIVPVRKSVPIKIKGLPDVTSVADVSELTAFLLKTTAQGKLSPNDSEIISRIAEKHIKALQLNDFEERLQQLEERINDEAC